MDLSKGGNMPYSKAHYYLIGLLIITLVAFWDSYFGKLMDAPVAHHFHGITATLWIILLAFQNWTIHNRKNHLHKVTGKLIFILLPLMIGSFTLVTWVGAQKSVGGHPFYIQFGQALLAADVLLTFSTSLQIYLALRWRRNVRLHSALMFGTLIGLLAPILSRLFPLFIPGMEITDLDTLYRFGYSMKLSVLISLIIPLMLYIYYRKDGWPWILAALIATLVYVLYATLGQTEIWAAIVIQITKINPVIMFSAGFSLGIMACLLGWIHGKK
jgi:uncharacterized membrane protein YhaH (DUF805 family)